MVRVYRERKARWKGKFTFTKISKKIKPVTNGTEVQQFNISSLLPMASK